MPIYEYECKRCEHLFEELLQAMEEPPNKCPSCGSKRLKRLVSRSSFVLKGEGWYVTDYARKDKKEKEKQKLAQNERAEKPKSKKKDTSPKAS
jgi:putative FmdB family regulatory protein